jgi:hypothetical protein
MALAAVKFRVRLLPAWARDQVPPARALVKPAVSRVKDEGLKPKMPPLAVAIV